jgi:hypothetical protein
MEGWIWTHITLHLRFTNSCFSKARYVVLGTGSQLKTQNDILASAEAGRKKTLKSTSSKPSLVDVTERDPESNKLYLSIYKAKVWNISSDEAQTNSARGIGNFLPSIQYLSLNRARFDLFNIGNKARHSRHSRLK